MSLRTAVPRPSSRAATVEAGTVAAVLAAAFLWQRAVREIGQPAASLSRGAGVGLLLLAGLVVLVGASARVRGIEVGLRRPSRADAVALVVVVPLALVAVTELVGNVTGTAYGALAMTHYGSVTPPGPVLTLVALGVVVGVPSLVLVCQVLVQGGLTRLFGGERAVVATTLVAGFVATNHSGLAAVPGVGKVVGVVAFVPLLALALYASERVERNWLRALAALPVALFLVVVVGSGVAEVETLAGALYAATRLAALGVAAWGYERDRSLLVPALAYLTLALADTAVLLSEAGGPAPF
jgi:hypothetical protein